MRLFGRFTMVHLVVASCLLICAGSAVASSGVVEQKHWSVDDWIRVMNFVVLAGALFFILKKPVVNALNGRIEDIKKQLDALENQKEQAEKTLAEYETKIATLQQEADAILAQYKEQGEAAKSRILEAAAASADKLKEQAKRNIDYEFKTARQELQSEIMTKALEKAEEMVRQSISADDQDRLVDEYLKKVVA